MKHSLTHTARILFLLTLGACAQRQRGWDDLSYLEKFELVERNPSALKVIEMESKRAQANAVSNMVQQQIQYQRLDNATKAFGDMADDVQKYFGGPIGR